MRNGVTRFYPVHGGRGILNWIPTVSEVPSSYEAQALEYFMVLITNPPGELLGGPYVRYKNYYLKKTRRQKIYCSRSCGAKQAAHEPLKEKREKEHS